ncbi:calphotin-like [Helicoverpa zea]|uniref:calphotin-like n=1 Tax=Helicoverpa zea TaxID=7113 RepID=UPI001F5A9FE0|nr:calphotin-like [Helicoverpa zea]
MKFLLSVAAVIAVAVAVPTQRGLVAPGPAGPVPAPEFVPISVGPAIIDSFEPIAIGPALVEAEFEPIAVGPAIVDFPLPDGGVVAEPVLAPSPLPVIPSPVAIIPGPAAAEAASATPLVQIILNINQAAAESHPISVGPAIVPEPVQVVEVAPEPVQVVEPAPIAPIAVNPIGVVAPEPVQVIEAAPVPAEPVVIGTPVLPEAAVVLPEALN